jgi:undecaprenyl-diphosphatase
MPVPVALSRIYRGEHHPTDVLGGMLFAALWLTAVTLLLRPSAVARDSTRRQPIPGSARGTLQRAGRATTTTG